MVKKRARIKKCDVLLAMVPEKSIVQLVTDREKSINNLLKESVAKVLSFAVLERGIG